MATIKTPTGLITHKMASDACVFMKHPHRGASVTGNATIGAVETGTVLVAYTWTVSPPFEQEKVITE